MSWKPQWWQKKLPDAPGAVLEAVAGLPPAGFPRWAMLALRRNEDAPGKAIPMFQRWYQPCPVCQKIVFLIHPYLMPALEEIVPDGGASDLEELGRHSLTDPLNLIRTHEPCRFFDRSEPWDFQSPEVKSLKDYLK